MGVTGIQGRNLLVYRLAIVVLAFCLLPDLASANEGRSEALANNPMVRDDLDISIYPGLLTTYSNLVFLSVAENASTGDVGAVIGRNIAFGLWIHRTPRFRDLDTADELFDSFILPETHQLVDLLFGMDNGFGLRLSFAAGLDTDDNESTESGDLVTTGSTSLGMDIQLGYSLDRRNYHGDIGAGVTLNYFEVLDDGRTAFKTGWVPSFELRHRSEIMPRRPVAGVVDFLLTRRAYTVTAEGDPIAEGSFGRWIMSIVGGPKLMLPGGFTLWVGAQLRYERLAGEVEGQEQPTLQALGPGLVASAELRLLDLLAIRAGAAYDFFWSNSRIPATLDDEAEADQGLGQRFHWSIGLGLEISGFRLDGTLSHDLIFGGPQSIGGLSPGLMGTVSASYSW